MEEWPIEQKKAVYSQEDEISTLTANRDPDFSPQSWSVNRAVGADNCYESNFYLSIALLSSNPTSIYTENIFHEILGPGFW